jgi:hypothetical protein
MEIEFDDLLIRDSDPRERNGLARASSVSCGAQEATEGRILGGRVDESKGDPGNALDRDEIATKSFPLSAFSEGLSKALYVK